MKVSERQVALNNNIKITACLMENDYGMQVEVLNLGGIITKILTKDSKGNLENVVLEYEDWNSYITNPSYFGAVIGRTAGRIYQAKATINDKVYEFAKNDSDNSLHGGTDGFNKKIWDVKTEQNDDSVIVQLHFVSEDLEENYPGKLDTYVIYCLNNDNELIIDYKATTDKDTLVNMTNHTYFNLSGNAKRSILNHKIYINSKQICELDDKLIPTGNMINVSENKVFDFQQAKAIGQDIDYEDKQISYASGYDHPFLINDSDVTVKLCDPVSKRTMQIKTSEPCVVMYTMNGADKDNKIANGQIQKKRFAVCLETQKLPIGYNEIFKEGSLLRKGETYTQKTKYIFGLEKE